LFFLKQPRNYDGGTMYIYLRITVDGIPKEMSTKRSWEPSRWSAKANRALGNKKDVKELNHYLDVLQTKAYDVRKELIDRGRVIIAMSVIKLLSGAEQRERALFNVKRKKEKNPCSIKK